MTEIEKRFVWIWTIGLATLIGGWASIQQWELLGFENAEIFGHMWGYDWRLQEFPAGLVGTDLAVGTQSFPAIDVLPLVLVNIFTSLLSLAMAERLLFLICIVLTALLGSRLHEEGVCFAVLAGATPLFWGVWNNGLVEDWGVFLLIATLLYLKRNKFILAGVLLGFTAYWGLVLGWMSGIFTGLYIGFHRKWDRRFLYLVGIAGVLVLPLLWFHWDRMMFGGHRTWRPPEMVDPMWMLNPWHHTDVASLFYFGRVDYADQIIRLHPASLGWIAIAVSLWSRSWTWWCLFFCCVGFACGPTFYWMGTSTGILNPFSLLLSWIPGAGLINHHGRWMLLAGICWLVLLSNGLGTLSASSGSSKWMKYGLLIAIVLEWWFYTPLGFPLMGTEPMADSPVLQSLQDVQQNETERLLRLPVRGPDVVFQQALYEQTIHHQPIWMNPNRPDIEGWFRLDQQSKWIADLAFTKEIPLDACVPSRVGILLVHQPYIALVRARFGEPKWGDDDYAAWVEFPRCGRMNKN